MKNKIFFNEEKHEYRDSLGSEYISVSKLVRQVEPEFPVHAMAANVAKRDNKSVEAVLSEWDAKRNRAAEIGNLIHSAHHNQIVNITRTPGMGPKKNEYWDDIAKSTWGYFSGYAHIDSEEKLFSEEHKVAGTADRICYRNKNVVDIWDFKTDEKGIVYQNQYNKFLSEPMEWLEHTNYNTYALKISCYGLLFEIRNPGYKIGSLRIIYIPPASPLDHFIVPIPYMKRDVEILFNLHKEKFKYSPAFNAL